MHELYDSDAKAYYRHALSKHGTSLNITHTLAHVKEIKRKEYRLLFFYE